MKNLNDLAKEVSGLEGLKESLSIAQIKEVLGVVSDLIAGEDGLKVCYLLIRSGDDRSKKKKRKSK